MRERGTLLFITGSGALSPNPDRAASGVTTTAEAVYVRMLHEAHTVVVCPIGPGERHEPVGVAEQLWRRLVARDEALTIIR